MLVLTRKPNQQLQIGSDIVITIVKVRGNTIRLGIEAPRDVRVIRSELEAKPDSQLGAEKLSSVQPTSGAKPASSDKSSSDGASSEEFSADMPAENDVTELSPGGNSQSDVIIAEVAGPSSSAAHALGGTASCHTALRGERAAQAKPASRRNPAIQIGREGLKHRAPLARAPLARAAISALALPSRS